VLIKLSFKKNERGVFPLRGRWLWS